MKSAIWAALFFAAMSVTASAFASGWSSNGGGFDDESNNIWFLGEKPVHYCVQVGSDYPLGSALAASMVQESIADWVAFFRARGFDTKSLFRETLKGIWQMPAGKPNKAALSFTADTSCQSDTEIKFLFGVTNDVVESLRSSNDENDLGMAIRKDYDHVTFRNPGIVWLAKFSTDPAKIRHLLLHEIGHVFGMRHDSVPVMDSRVAYHLARPFMPGAFFGKIENAGWPYAMSEGRLEISDTFGSTFDRLFPSGIISNCPAGYFPNAAMPPRVLNQLGFSPSGCHHVTAKVTNPDFTVRQFTFALELEDSVNGNKVLTTGLFTHNRIANISHPGPSVYTLATFASDPSKKARVSLRLDQDPNLFPARGSFAFGGKLHAARISYEKGPMIEIFFPDMAGGVWWPIRNAYDNLDLLD